MMWMFFYVFIILFTGTTGGQWSTKNNEIYYGTEVYNVRGVNWFGAETECRVPQGLWVHSLDYYLDLLRGYDFNSVRIPFSYEIATNLDTVVNDGCVAMSPSLQGKTFRQALHMIIGGAKYRNMSILLDFHTIGGVITEFPSSPTYVTEAQFLETWSGILWEYGTYPNLLGIDLKNEPHGRIRWPVWGSFVTHLIANLEKEVPAFKGLFFVEGIQDPSDKSVWGGSFSRLGNALGTVPNPRIIFSPHVYGVSVRGDIALQDSDPEWNKWFGFIQKKYANAVCIGEIGGWFEGDDETWHIRVLDFLRRLGIQNAFYWCLNPNSIDTGGLLDFDWTTVSMEKINFCRDLQPDPVFPSFQVQ